MTIREIGGIRGFRRPIETVGTSRVSRNADLIADGGGIGRRRRRARRLPLDADRLFSDDCTCVSVSDSAIVVFVLRSGAAVDGVFDPDGFREIRVRGGRKRSRDNALAPLGVNCFSH